MLFYAALAAMMLEAAPAPVPARDTSPSAAPVQVPRSTPSVRLASTAATRPAVRPARAPTPSEALASLAIRKELPITQWLRPGEFAWDDDGVPAGATTIVVNIRARVLSAYRDGVEIGRSSIVYGSDEKPTPIGVFPILEKNAVYFSRTYNRAPMPHMMRLTRDGVAIHGSEVGDDLASHGCIGLPKEFAGLLFSSARVGDRVIVWKGERAPTV